MVVHLARPDLAARVRVHRIRGRTAVREVHRVATLPGPLVRTNGNGRADAGLRMISPVGAARSRVEREDVAAFASDEHAAARHGGLRASGIDAREPDRPLEFEL